jgi:hypothetical protein
MPKIPNWSPTDISYSAIGQNKVVKVWKNDLTDTAVWLHKNLTGGTEFSVYVKGEIAEHEVRGGNQEGRDYTDRNTAHKSAVQWMRDHPYADPEDFDPVPTTEYPSGRGWEMTEDDLDRLDFSYRFEYDGMEYVVDLQVLTDGFTARMEKYDGENYETVAEMIEDVQAKSVGKSIEKADEYMRGHGKDEYVKYLINEVRAGGGVH